MPLSKEEIEEILTDIGVPFTEHGPFTIYVASGWHIKKRLFMTVGIPGAWAIHRCNAGGIVDPFPESIVSNPFDFQDWMINEWDKAWR